MAFVESTTLVEDVLKPTTKNRPILVVNMWGGRNIIEVALVSFCVL